MGMPFERNLQARRWLAWLHSRSLELESRLQVMELKRWQLPGAAMAGMVTLAKLGTGEPTAGDGAETMAIAAAAIGGTSLAGGKGTILGTVLGAFTISALKIGLIVVKLDTFYQFIAIGLIIIFATYMDTLQGMIVKLVKKGRKEQKT